MAVSSRDGHGPEAGGTDTQAVPSRRKHATTVGAGGTSTEWGMTAIVYSNHADEDQLRPSGGSSIHSLQKGPTEITAISLNEDVAIALGPAEEVVGIGEP